MCAITVCLLLNCNKLSFRVLIYLWDEAYQSALISTPLLLLRILLSVLRTPSLVPTLFTVVLIGMSAYMA